MWDHVGSLNHWITGSVDHITHTLPTYNTTTIMNLALKLFFFLMIRFFINFKEDFKSFEKRPKGLNLNHRLIIRGKPNEHLYLDENTRIHSK